MGCGTAQQGLISQKATDTIGPSYFIEGSFTDFEVDKLGSIFIITSKNEIIKFDNTGKELFRYSNKRFGDVYSLDVSNPQKILVYYGDFKTAIILDNTLSEMTTIFLEELLLWDIQTIAMSNDNQMWIYDNAQKQVIKITYQGKTIVSSNSLHDQNMGDKIISQMKEFDQKVYLNTNGEGLIICDNYGQFIHIIEEIKTHHFQIFGESIVYLNDNRTIMMYEDKMIGTETLLEIKGNNKILDFHISDNMLYLLDQDGLKKEKL